MDAKDVGRSAAAEVRVVELEAETRYGNLRLKSRPVGAKELPLRLHTPNEAHYGYSPGTASRPT